MFPTFREGVAAVPSHAEDRGYRADSPQVARAFARRTGIDTTSLDPADVAKLAGAYFLAERMANQERRLLEENPPEQPTPPALPYSSVWVIVFLSALILFVVAFLGGCLS